MVRSLGLAYSGPVYLRATHLPLRWPRSQSPSTDVTSLISAALPSPSALTVGSVRRTHSWAQGPQFLF